MPEVYSIMLEARRLFHALAALADAVHEDLNVTASQRAVMEVLATSSNQTVPGIARLKGVSRQHIQGLVNQLVDAGLVALGSNPAHKRSPILNLTPEGHDCFAEMSKREKNLIRKMTPKLREYDLASVVGCLREMNAQIQALMPTDQPQDRRSPKRKRS